MKLVKFRSASEDHNEVWVNPEFVQLVLDVAYINDKLQNTGKRVTHIVLEDRVVEVEDKLADVVVELQPDNDYPVGGDI